MIYDLAIIGGGPAGYSAAFYAAENKLKTIIFEGAEMGGTCLNRGCVPTKFLEHVSEVYSSMNNAGKYGIKINNVELNYEDVKKHEYEIVNNLKEGLIAKINATTNIKYVNKFVTLNNKNEIVTDDKEIYEAKNILIATGSKAKTPFHSQAITSDELLKLKNLPKSIAIIGGGVIAVEFADIFCKLGCQVEMYIRGERILKKWDKDIAVNLASILKKRGIKIYTKCTNQQLKECAADVVLSATGRTPNTSNFKNHNIRLGLDDGIVVDENFETNIKGIYAAGDVICESDLLAHVAMDEGKAVVNSILGIEKKKSAVVNCIYVNPEIGSVGLTVEQAKSIGMDVVSAKQLMYTNARTIIADGERGFIKLVAQKKTGRLVGAHLMCERASDIISELTLAINNELTIDNLILNVRQHPSFSEEICQAAQLVKEKIDEDILCDIQKL